MKKCFVFLMMGALLGGVLQSCKNDAGEAGDSAGAGKVTIAFGFDDTGEVGTRAYAISASKPTTSWAQNVKSLMILFVNGSGMIADARSIVVPTATDASNKTFTFTNVAAGQYTGYLIANFDQGGVNANFSATSVKGMSASALLMNMVAVSGWAQIKDAASEANATGYEEAGEVFLASLQSLDVVADKNADYTNKPFQLKRAVSMFRLRINKNFTSTTGGNVTDNNVLDLGNAACALRIRRAGTGLDYEGKVTPTPPAGTNVLYATGFNTTNTPPTSGYSNGDILDPQQHAWKDVRILPGGATGINNSSKFDIAISAWAPVDYWAHDANGASVKLTTASLVQWTGIVEGAVAANNILEVNVELKSPGITGAVPAVGTHGNLEISVDLLPWGNIEQTTVQM